MQLLINLLTGGLTGYLTNNAAVKMLFKKYGPFGGIILKTREEFIEKLSQLIERDIINGHTLENEFKQKEFSRQFQVLINDLLNKNLTRTLSGINFEDIPEFEKTWNNLLKLAIEGFSELLPIIQDLPVEDLLSHKQLNHIIDDLGEKVFRYLEQSDILESFLNCISKYLQDKEISDLISERNLQALILKFIDISKENWPIYKNKLIKLLNGLDLNSFFCQIEPDLKKLIQYLQHNEIFLEKLDQVINNLLDEGLQELRKLDYTLFELVAEEQRPLLEEFLKNKLSVIIALSLNWLKNNREDLILMIQNAVKKVIETEAANFSGKIKRWISNLFLQSNFSNTGLMGRVINTIQGRQEVQLTSIELAEEIITFFKETNINAISNFIEKDEQINSEMITKLLKNKIVELEIDRLNLVPMMNQMYPNLVELITPVNLQQIALKLIPLLSNHKLNYLIDPFLQESAGLKPYFLKKLIKEKEDLKATIKSNLTSYLTDKKIQDIIPERFWYNQQNNFNLDKYLNQLKCREISPVYNYFKPTDSSLIADYLLNQLIINSPDILKGRIADLISGNLTKLSESDVQKVIEDFMGRELKPISYFGAGLGVVFASLLYYYQQFIGNSSLESSLLLSFLVYSFMGYITNVIALKMIFKPYTKKKILGIKIPFTPGVIAREKDRFAGSMGKFINQELLHQESITLLFKNNRAKLKEQTHDLLRKDNYRIVTQLLKTNLAEIEHNLMLIMQNKQEYIIDRLSLTAFNLPVSGLQPKNLEKLFSDQKGPFLLNFKNYLIRNLEKLFGSNKTFNELFPESVQNKIFNKITTLTEQITKNLINQSNKLDQFEKMFNKLEEKKTSSLNYLFPKITGSRLASLGQDLLLSAKIDVKLNKLLLDFFDNYGNKITIFLIDKITRLLKEKEEILTSSLLSHLKTKGGLAYFALSFFNLDETVINVIQILINDQLPNFLKRREQEINQLLQQCLLAITADKKIGQTNESEQMGTGVSFREALNMIIDTEFTYNYFKKIVDTFFELRLEEILKITDASSFTEIYNRNLSYFNYLQVSLSKEIDSQQKYINDSFAELLITIGKEEILPEKISALTKTIGKEELSQAIISILINPQTADCLQKIILSFHQIENLKLGDLVSEPILTNAIRQTINSLYQQDKFWTQCNVAVNKFILNLNQEITPATKDFMIELILTGAFDALENNLSNLNTAINLVEVTEKEITAMNPEELEELFQSFAGKYFSRLEAYGLTGGVFGLLVEIIKSW